MESIYVHPKLRYGDHLPVLMRALSITTGPVVELGSGFFSTPVLHWACYPKRRWLCTYENDPVCFNAVTMYGSRDHLVKLVTDWDDVDLSTPWSVAFVDHEPGVRRIVDVLRLKHAEYIVCHDTEDRREHRYGWNTILDQFAYRFRFKSRVHCTTVFSNVHDVSTFME
jgi:hypothetical protein